MRKLIFGMNLSADGCCDHAAGFNPDEDVHDYFTRLTLDADTLLYGRKTYELMVPYWTDKAKETAGLSRSDSDFAQAFASVPQMIVASTTLTGSPLENTTIVNGDLGKIVRDLKAQEGRSILTGGVSLPTELLKLGLIDEVHLLIHPLLAGKGRRLFDDALLPQVCQLNLLESSTLKSGCMALHYSNLSKTGSPD